MLFYTLTCISLLSPLVPLTHISSPYSSSPLSSHLVVLGNDIASGPIWIEYISFLQAPKPGTDAFIALFPASIAGQEEQARSVLLRRAYQRATFVPSHALDSIYRQYEAFETFAAGGNKALSR